MNRNLHSPTKLTEFARDFDIEPDTFFAKFVNKITNVYNSGYNTVNVVPTRASFQQSCSQEDIVECPTPTHSFVGSSKDEKSLTDESIDDEPNSNEPSTSKFDECNANQIDDFSSTFQPAARTQSSVMQRISNLMIKNNNNLSNYKDSELHQFWMPDNKSKECYECSQKFSTFRRKHHCRLCGQIFCSKCCNQVVPGKIINCSGDLKVCTYCSRLVLKYLKSSDINSDLKSDLQALQDDLASKFQLQNDDRQMSVTESTFPQRKVSVGYQEERFFSQPKYLLSNADRKNILQQSTSLKILYEDVAKALPSHNHGSDIINYLITKNKSSNKSQAIAILTAMAEAGYITEIETAGVSPVMMHPINLFESETTNSSNPSSDGDYLHEFNENAYYKLLRSNEIMLNSGTFQLNLDVDNSSVHLNKPESNVTGVDGVIQSHGSLLSLSQIKEIDSEASIMSTTGSKALLEAFCKHEDLLLTQLLRNENLDESWSKTLIPICARIVNTWPPEMIGMDQMDIRNYVHFKKVPDGSRNDCATIRGAVFTKNVVHKDMATIINEARILLLQCPIVYQRDEGKYVSIETLLRQEREHLTNVVGRIRSLNPNVIIVHKNVSGIAQDMLRNLNITLVVDVKLSVLKRLSRCLQCDIVPTIDSNIGRPKLGLCEKFYIKNFTNSMGATKTLMFTETPSNPRGCSVLLRGGDFQELIRVKRVAAFLLFTRYNWRMELSFLLNEFACPPLPKPNIFDSKDYSPCTEINATTNLTNEQNDDYDAQQTSQLNLEHRLKKCDKKIEKKNDEKIITKKNVQDFSDPLRAKDIMTSSCDLESPVKFAVEQPCDNRFRTALNSTILSISPFSQFPLPFLETEHGKKCLLRSCFPKEMFYSKQWSDNVEKTYERTNSSMTNQNSDESRPPHAFLQYKVVEPAESRNFQTLLANFRASGGILKKKQKMDVIARKSKQVEPNNAALIPYRDALDIHNHQRLPVLFSNFYYNPDGTSSFCVHPNLLNMVFYGDNDIMLGQFLEEYCFSSSYICKFCKLPMLGHVRRYVHSMGSVSVKLNEEGQSHKQISMFSWCLKCQEFSKIAHMQRDTWCLSFGKYLEMRFHSHAYKRRRLESDEYDSTTEIMKTCSHSLHRDHVQYFSYNGIVASFSYTPIEVWEIQLPSLIVLLKPMKAKDASKYLLEMKAFTSTGHQLYASIYDRLATLLSEVEFPMLTGLKGTVNSDQLAFREKANQVAIILDDQPLNTHAIEDAMFLMKKLLADNFEIWIQRLNDVHQQYRSICVASKQDTTTSSPSITNTPTQSLSQSQSERGADELQSENLATDSGFICTEDLKSEPGSPNVINPLNAHPLNFHSRDSESDKSVESPVPTHSSNEMKSITSSDKKSMKNIIRDLLPNDKNAPQMLISPIPSNEYFTLPVGCVPILVHDSDYSSVIAFSLASLDYRKKLETLSYCDVQRKSFDSVTDIDEKDSQLTPTNQKDGDKDRKSKSTQTHVEVNFQAPSSTTQFTCKIYFARDFDSMRTKLLNVNENGDENDKNQMYQKSTSVSDEEKMDKIRSYFIRSMSKSARWEARGGKSGSKFCKTLDDRFILKEMTKNDISKFENFAPNYFDYINQCVQQNRLTLLAKIVGVFRINIKKKDNPLIEKSLLIMENLFYDCNIDNKFDLKGSLRNRHVDPNNQNGEETVLLDENLIQLSFLDPLYILTHSKVILREAIGRDAIFLEKNDVMDYSLLVGLDKNGRMLVLGIIDYIRTYTLDKKLESLVKTNLMGKQGLPTIVSPKLYRHRFTEAMDRYFLVAPDRWEGLEKQPIV